MSEPAVSVIIPTYRDDAALQQTLNALAAQTDDRFEILVVNNDPGRDVDVDGLGLDLHLLEEAQPGPYAARNTGVDAAAGPILAFTDAGCRPAPDWIATGRAAIDAAPDLVVAGDVRLDWPEPPDDPWQRFEAATAFPIKRYAAQGFGVTANLWVPRSVWGAVGPFRNVMSGDDRGWCLRAGGRARVRFAADNVVLHEPRAREEILAKQRRIYAARAAAAPGQTKAMALAARALPPVARDRDGRWRWFGEPLRQIRRVRWDASRAGGC